MKDDQMANRISILVTALLFITTSFVLAEDVSPPKKVFVEKGNIYYCPSGNQRIQLTKSGKDKLPLLSPDGKKVVFIRKSKEKAYDPIDGDGSSERLDPFADQIWAIDIDGTNEKMLVRDYNPEIKEGYDKMKVEDVIGFIEDMKFSPDGKTIYFLIEAWVTSSALHAVNIDGSNEHFITDANTLKIIDKGDYKGDLIISQHRYYVGAGSYDWYYVFTPEGKEVGPLGDDLDKVDWDILYFESEK